MNTVEQQAEHLSQTLEELKHYQANSVTPRELEKILSEAMQKFQADMSAKVADVVVAAMKQAHKSDTALKSEIHSVEQSNKDTAGNLSALKGELEGLKSVLPTASFERLSALVVKTEDSTREKIRMAMAVVDAQVSSFLTGKSYVISGTGGKSLVEGIL